MNKNNKTNSVNRKEIDKKKKEVDRVINSTIEERFEKALKQAKIPFKKEK